MVNSMNLVKHVYDIGALGWVSASLTEILQDVKHIENKWHQSERRHYRRSGIFMVNFNNVSHLFLGFLLLALNKCLLGTSQF